MILTIAALVVILAFGPLALRTLQSVVARLAHETSPIRRWLLHVALVFVVIIVFLTPMIFFAGGK